MRRPSRRSLTDQDQEEWRNYARHVRALPGRLLTDAPASAPIPTPAPPPAPMAAALSPTPHKPAAPVAIGTAPAGLDRASWEKFRAGRIAPARRLDLHGHTAQHAHAALHRFLVQAQAQRLRCVEVITGRGPSDAGLIRRELPFWLDHPSLAPMILAAERPNPGSVRLLLRRRR